MPILGPGATCCKQSVCDVECDFAPAAPEIEIAESSALVGTPNGQLQTFVIPPKTGDPK